MNNLKTGENCSKHCWVGLRNVHNNLKLFPRSCFYAAGFTAANSSVDERSARRVLFERRENVRRWYDGSRMERTNLCVFPNRSVSSVAPARSGTKPVWRAYSNPHWWQFAPNLARPDCCPIRNSAATPPIVPRWMQFERVWSSFSANRRHQSNCRLFWNEWKWHWKICSKHKTARGWLTIAGSGFAFDGLQIMFSAQDLVLNQRKLLASGQLSIARIAGEAG